MRFTVIWAKIEKKVKIIVVKTKKLGQTHEKF